MFGGRLSCNEDVDDFQGQGIICDSAMDRQGYG